MDSSAGTAEDIGLRSTRIRTLDRSVVSIPNGQIANERLEDLSSRDKFWLHPILSLRNEAVVRRLHLSLLEQGKLSSEEQVLCDQRTTGGNQQPNECQQLRILQELVCSSSVQTEFLRTTGTALLRNTDFAST
ncbi:MAG: mechanosensitive ion channel domain-containing protein [Acidobacteriota bacterium]